MPQSRCRWRSRGRDRHGRLADTAAVGAPQEKPECLGLAGDRVDGDSDRAVRTDRERRDARISFEAKTSAPSPPDAPGANDVSSERSAFSRATTVPGTDGGSANADAATMTLSPGCWMATSSPVSNVEKMLSNRNTPRLGPVGENHSTIATELSVTGSVALPTTTAAPSDWIANASSNRNSAEMFVNPAGVPSARKRATAKAIPPPLRPASTKPPSGS
jgi:hypothetical protein